MNLLFSKKESIIVLVFVAFNMISFIARIDVMFLALLDIWFVSVIYTLKKLQQRTLYFFFLIAFFVFLIGGHLCYEYFGMKLAHYYSDSYYFHSNFCMFLSLLFILIAFYFHDCETRLFRLSHISPTSNFVTKVTNNYHRQNVNKIRTVSKRLYYIFYWIWMYELLDTVVYVTNNSYYSYYTDYESSVPFAIRALAEMTPYFFYLFLATFPKKKECLLPIVMYMALGLISLFTGKRGNFVFMTLFVILYFVIRQYYDNGIETWIKKIYIIVGIAAIPFLSVFLYLMNAIRFGNKISDASFSEMFLSFFQTQGVSASVIRMEKYYEDRLRSDALYSLFGTVKYFRTNTIIKLVFHPKYNFSYVHHNIAFARNGNSLDAALSYLGLHDYLSGAGMGSCYVAELYHDGGYAGIAIGSIIYGFVMSTISKLWINLKKYNVWLIAIGFAMAESFVKAPRWNYDIFISYFLDLGMWMALALVFVLVKLRIGVKTK